MTIRDHARYQVWVDGQCVAAFSLKHEAYGLAKAQGGIVKDTHRIDEPEHMEEHTQ